MITVMIMISLSSIGYHRNYPCDGSLAVARIGDGRRPPFGLSESEGTSESSSFSSSSSLGLA